MKRLIAKLKLLGYSIADDAKDADVMLIAQKAIGESKLTLAEAVELQGKGADVVEKSPTDTLVERIVTGVSSGIGDAFTKAMGPLVEAVKGKSPAEPEPKKDGQPPATKGKTGDELPDLNIDEKTIDLLAKRHGYTKPEGGAGNNGGGLMDIWAMAKGFNAQEGNIVIIRVKSAVERFSDESSKLKHRKGMHAGLVVIHNGAELSDLSPRKNALFAAWVKFQAGLHLTDHDKLLVLHTIENEKFVNCDANSTEPRLLKPHEKNTFHRMLANSGEADQLFKKAFSSMAEKATTVIDDSTSGGEYAVPEFFNYAAALEPALTQQVSPFVDVIQVARGSSARAFSVGLASVTSGPAEPTAITPLTTDDLINSIGCDFFPANCTIEFGNDWMGDAAPQMGMIFRDRINTAFGVYFDKVIVSGNGTTEPLGIKNQSGTVAVPSVNGAAGPLTWADTVNLLFGVPKAYRESFAKNFLRFMMTDTTYGRIRTIATGVTGDTRAIHGEAVLDYLLHNVPVGIPQQGLSNSDIILAQLKGYTWYQRQGVVFRQTSEGRTNLLANKTTLVGRSRQGGRLKFGSYAAVMDDAQT